MALTTCELVWVKQALGEMILGELGRIELICDNQAALLIASNPISNERTKHIKVDYHFIKEKEKEKEIISRCISTTFFNSNTQLADILTKSLKGPHVACICNRLHSYNIYALAL